MPKKKINVGVLYGGKSAEHEISVISAQNVIDAMDKKKYNPVRIFIDKEGKWLHGKDVVALIPHSGGKLVNLSKSGSGKKLDVVFPVLHGTYGEDGTVQGLLELASIPFVGASVLGSAVGMDKDVMKRLLKEAGIPIGKFVTYINGDKFSYEQVRKKVGTPFFVKPANLGSSVGISKVKSKAAFKKAISEAFKYDNKIVIEEHIEGREIECAVLGNDDPKASKPGEIITSHEFYSYQAKYLDEKGTETEVPAKLPGQVVKKVQELAIQTFKVLSCAGMGRVDVFVKKSGKVIVNEINTIPGFTPISMYPKMWEASGIGYSQLIDKLIKLAFERFKREQRIKTSY